MSGVIATDVYSAVVAIGNIPIRLRTGDSSFLSLIRHRYGDFLSPNDAAEVDLHFELVPGGAISHEEDVRVIRNGSRWSAERADFRLDWDAERNCGSARQSLNPYSLDGMLRILHSIMLATRGGFLLHSASVMRNGRSFLFFGPSGAGKTTLARLAPFDAKVLSDEISYVRPDKQTFFAFGTPFSGELAEPGENVSAPISALYHLVQGARNRVLPLKPADAVRLLMRSVLFFAEDSDLVKRVFSSLCNLVSCVPICELEFVPHASVWDLVQ